MSEAQTPLVDLLCAVPPEARTVYAVSETESMSIPYGQLCHSAAAELRRLSAELAALKAAMGGQKQSCGAVEIKGRGGFVMLRVTGLWTLPTLRKPILCLSTQSQRINHEQDTAAA